MNMYSTIISIKYPQSLTRRGASEVVIVDYRHDLMDAEVGIKAYRGTSSGSGFANLR